MKNKTIKLLIDFGSIKTGGGAQLAVNFLKFIREHPVELEKIYLLIPEHGPLSQHITQNRQDGVLIYPNSYWRRKLFELTTLRKFVSEKGINVFYTFFGAGIPAPRGVRSIVSVAYPTICYPDSPFWKFLPLKDFLHQHTIDVLRKRRIRLADTVIAETAIMAKRLVKYVKVNPERIRISPPSPSVFISDKPFQSKQNSKPCFLLLGSLDRHKNIWRLPDLAQALKAGGLKDFAFLISTTRDAFLKAYPECRQVNDVLDCHFEFLGIIPSEKIQAVYDRADLLMNISDLESFSNNYMEAWKSGLPLICSNTDFATYICKDSAIYVDPHTPPSSAKAIFQLISNPERQRALTLAGKQRLAELPTIEEKFSQIMKIIQEVK